VLVPLFGERPITELTADELMRPIELVGQIGSDRALVKLKARKRLHRPGRKARPVPDQARALFAFAKMVLNWASEPDADYGLDRNPLDRVRKARRFGSPVRRDHILGDGELTAFTLAIERLPAPHRQAYQVLLHSGLRLNEAARARWSEFEDEIWTIPTTRMKGRNSGQGQARAHIVPLTPALRKIFDAMPRGARGDYVFSVQDGAAPIAAGIAVLIAGSLQFTRWKARRLACCREEPVPAGPPPADAGTAWRHGARLGLHCARCCANLMAILLALGVMDLGAMAVVTAAITAERLAPAGGRVARAIGALAAGAGLFLIGRAIALV